MANTNLKQLIQAINNSSACIFDLDGTLLDTLGIWNQTDKFAIDTYGKKPSPSLREIHVKREAIARPLGYDGYCNYLINEYQMSITLPDKLLEIRWEYADNLLKNLDYNPGVVDFVREVKKLGKKIALATMSTAHQIEVYEKENKKTSSQMVFHGYFDYVGIKDYVSKSKPDPEVYLKASQALEISPDQCIVFEDSIEGVEAAKRAGMVCIAVRDDYNEEDFDKIKARADYWVESFSEIVKNM